MAETPTLIGRAAEAMFLRGRKEGGTDAATLDETGPEMRRWLEGHVRLVLEVMRNPGPAVIAAVENMAEERYNAAPDMLRWYGEDVWAAGIDAALAAPDEGQSP